MSNDLTLWGIGTSRTMRAHWMLLELGLEYEFHPIQSRTGETMTEEFLKLNPRHKIPVLRHGGLVFTESAAIIQYLSEAFEAPADFYVPADPIGRARLHEWCYFIMSELDAGALYVVRRHDGLRHLYGDAPRAVESARNYFIQNIEAMASRIGTGGQFLMGDRFSIADILLTTCLDWALADGIRMSDALLTYRRRVVLRPAYRSALERNFPAAKSI